MDLKEEISKILRRALSEHRDDFKANGSTSKRDVCWDEVEKALHRTVDTYFSTEQANAADHNYCRACGQPNTKHVCENCGYKSLNVAAE